MGLNIGKEPNTYKKATKGLKRRPEHGEGAGNFFYSIENLCSDVDTMEMKARSTRRETDLAYSLGAISSDLI